jgi:hypothetical protein
MRGAPRWPKTEGPLALSIGASLITSQATIVGTSRSAALTRGTRAWREGRLVRATLMVQGAGSTTGQAPRFLFPRGAWACWNSSSTNDRLSALDGGEFAASAGGGQPKACRYLPNELS